MPIRCELGPYIDTFQEDSFRLQRPYCLGSPDFLHTSWSLNLSDQ